MRKRDIVRHVPPFSKHVRYIEAVEGMLRERTRDIEIAEGMLRERTRDLEVAQGMLRQQAERVATLDRSLSDHVRYTEVLEGTLSQVVFSDVTSLVEKGMEEEDGLPIPSAGLRFMVVGNTDAPAFVRSGAEGAQLVIDLIARQGKELAEVGKVLDLGCGCGRVIRHLRRRGAEELHGCDCNAKAIAWCQRFLPFGTFRVNDLEPPLPYHDGMFGLIYAYSIFTHLPEPLQYRWSDEIRRVLAPGGYFVLTVHGRRFLAGLGEAERAAFDRGELVVIRENLAGSNSCAVFHPEPYVREVLARGFEIVDLVPEGATACGCQDVYLLRRTA